MKPTPPARPHWSIFGLIVAGSALLFWGCVHTREIVRPGRKVEPPKTLRGRLGPTPRAPAAPLVPAEPAPVVSPPAPDVPTSIDVPLIDRNGR